jgi:hypothetical protein
MVILLLMLLAAPVGLQDCFHDSITNHQVNPTVLMQGERGILTVTISNTSRREAISAAKTEYDRTAVSGHGESA